MKSAAPESPERLGALIRELERHVTARTEAWPDELFLFVSRITPLVNVDLLIRDDAGRTLLTWRDDRFFGPGWHVPGGIIRFQETAAERIRIVAKTELGATVEFGAAPVLVQESIASARRDRGHFISLLYACRLTSDLDPRRRYAPAAPIPDQWAWHEKRPATLIREQAAYAAFMG